MALPLSLATASGPGLFSLPGPSATSTWASPLPASGLVTSSPLLTRILELRDFHADLKTHDIQAVFQPWEDERGGFKIKWVDDGCVYVVFADPAVAKRAYLTRLLHAHPGLKNAPGKKAQIRPYDGANVNAILASVQHRPRSRLGGSHARGTSSIGSIGSIGSHSSVGSLASIPEPGSGFRKGASHAFTHGHSASATSVPAPPGFGGGSGSGSGGLGERKHHHSAASLSSMGGALGLPPKPSQSFTSGSGFAPGRFQHRTVPSGASSSSSTSLSRWAGLSASNSSHSGLHDPDETVTAPPTPAALPA